MRRKFGANLCSGLAVEALLLASLILLASTIGCGSKPTATVTGQVTYKGTPLSGGSITFHGEGGFVRSAYIDAGGRYMIVGAPPGAVKVAVVSAQPAAGAAPPAAGGTGKGGKAHPSGKGGSSGPIGGGVTLPPKYKDPTQSGLAYTLTAGQQSIDIPLN